MVDGTEDSIDPSSAPSGFENQYLDVLDLRSESNY